MRAFTMRFSTFLRTDALKRRCAMSMPVATTDSKRLTRTFLKKPEAMGSAEDMKAAKEPLAPLMSFIYFFTRCNASGLTALYANQLRQTEADIKSRFGEAFTRDLTAVLNDSLTADSTRALGKIADRLIALMK